MSIGYLKWSCPGALLMLMVASTVGAETTPPAPAILWYRSSEGCPDGASFLASVGERASLVRLAEAGDRVDFVVNLALTKEGARGRIERETERGTVAIREVDDESCARVAEVVALNLSLALDPAALESTEVDERLTTKEPAEPEHVTTSTDEGSLQGDKLSAESPEGEKQASNGAAPPGVGEIRDDDGSEGRAVRFRVGFQGGVQSGVTTQLMARAALFVEAQGLIAWAPELTFRVAAVGARGIQETSLGSIKQAFWAGRVELCPLAFGGETISISPCAAGEIGQIWASGPSTDAALWGSMGALARGVWAVVPPFALEADFGVDFPLRRYEVVAGSTLLYRSAPVGISAVLGASFAF